MQILVIVIDGDTGDTLVFKGSVTVVYDGCFRYVLRAPHAWPGGTDGVAEMHEEGMNWARGWDSETERALLAAYALHA